MEEELSSLLNRKLLSSLLNRKLHIKAKEAQEKEGGGGRQIRSAYRSARAGQKPGTDLSVGHRLHPDHIGVKAYDADLLCTAGR